MTGLRAKEYKVAVNTDDLTTKPTIETVLIRLDDFRNSVDARFAGIDQRFASVDARQEELQDQLYGLEEQVVIIRKGQLDMRTELRELVALIKEHLPTLK